MIYLDNAATTRVSDDVFSVMRPFLQEAYGNPGSIYKFGIEANEAVTKARVQVADFFNCDPNQIIFTSGGSEGNNFVINGVFENLRIKSFTKREVVLSAIEHDSVRNSVDGLVKRGLCDEYIVLPNSYGKISTEVISDAIHRTTGLVSVMHTNNETGVKNDVEDIGRLCSENNVLFHTDCVQAAGSYKLDVGKINCDFATISGHKIHGPKGIGAVFVKDLSNIQPLIFGGAVQEQGFRGGTENVAGIVGLGEACRLADIWREDNPEYIKQLKDCFLWNLSIDNNTWRINGSLDNKEQKTLNIQIDGVDAQTLVLLMSNNDICISAGSACCAHDIDPSHVLISMGLSKDQALSSVRVSFSKYNTMEEVRFAAKMMAKCVKYLSCNIKQIEEADI